MLASDTYTCSSVGRAPDERIGSNTDLFHPHHFSYPMTCVAETFFTDRLIPVRVENGIIMGADGGMCCSDQLEGWHQIAQS